VHEVRDGVVIALALVAALLGVVSLAKRFGVPYPIALVLGGAALGFVPGLPSVELAPDIVLLVVLPPLLFAAAWNTSWRDFKADKRAIGLLSVGLVVATTAVVAVVARAVFDLPWAAAFALGAVVSPTDAIAATATADRLGVPRRMVTILEGESLVNDASGLVAYRLAVGAALAGGVTVGSAIWQFGFVSLGGVVVGLVVGVAFNTIERRIDDPPLEIVLSIVVAYGAYMAGELLGMSGVLACVSAGLLSGQHSPRALGARTRLEAIAVWETMAFVLNGLVFMLLGLQLRRVLADIGADEIGPVTRGALVVAGVVVAARLVWMFPGTYLPRLIPSIRRRDPPPPWQHVVVMGWAGMRGAVSLALALALPRAGAAHGGGAAFPGRGTIVYVTFVVILVTLVGQGLTLPALIRKLGVRDDGGAAREEAEARLRAARSAQAKLFEVARDAGIGEDAAAHLHQHYAGRIARLEQRVAERQSSGQREAAQERRGYRWLQRALVRLEREAVIEMRNEGVIGDAVLRRIERDFDLTEARMSAEAAHGPAAGAKGSAPPPATSTKRS